MRRFDFIIHVSHWTEFPSARFQPRNDAAEMDGRSSPVGARTQMTKRQKATDSGTPRYAHRASAREVVEIMDSTRGETGASWMLVPVAFGSSHLRSTVAGINGAGFCSGARSLTHGQDSSPAQQHLGLALAPDGPAEVAATHDCTWDNWMTSPMNNAMMDLKLIARVRGVLIREIPNFLRKCYHRNDLVGRVTCYLQPSSAGRRDRNRTPLRWQTRPRRGAL